MSGRIILSENAEMANTYKYHCVRAHEMRSRGIAEELYEETKKTIKYFGQNYYKWKHIIKQKNILYITRFVVYLLQLWL